jgi:large subunit ribosomal protein L2
MIKYLNYFIFSINKKVSIGTRPLSGRNFLGTICVHHQSGGNKKNYLYVDFYRRINSFGYIYKIIKCPNRTGYLGSIIYENGLFSYILLSEGLKINSKIYSGNFSTNKDINQIGITIPLNNIRLFSIINNIELYPYSGGIITRSAGSSAIITTKKKENVIVKLKSG